jgi:hypothetical protein
MILSMRILLPAAMFALAASPALADDQRIMVMDFDRVQVEGPYQVTLTVGPTSAAVATGSRAALERVTIEVQGRTLRIRPNRSAWGGGYPGERAGGPVTVQASTRELRGASIIGPGSLSIDRAKGLRIDLGVSGSGRLGIANVDADQLVVNLNGSGKIMLGGKARQLRATIGGSGDLDGSAFGADNADLTADTSGAIAFTALRTAKVRANGAGDVAIAGPAACTVTGLAAGIVRCGNSN